MLFRSQGGAAETGTRTERYKLERVKGTPEDRRVGKREEQEKGRGLGWFPEEEDR